MADDYATQSTRPAKQPDAEFFNIARRRYDEAAQAESLNRAAGIDDLRFVNGEHWSQQALTDRGVGTPDERPTLTVNPLKTLGHQVINDQRQNRPMINVSPVGDGSDVKVAEMYRGMIRKIQRDSDGEIAVDTALQGAVYNGWGFWRVGTECEAEDSFDQVLVWRRIRNPMTVFCDPDHQDPTTSDKQWCFEEEYVDLDVFKQEHPNALPLNWDSAQYSAANCPAWFSNRKIRRVKYWVVESENATLVKLDNGFVGFQNELAANVKEMIAAGTLSITDRRTVERKTVKCYRMTAFEVLDEYEWLDDIIPIVRVTGDELDINGEVILSGIVRDAKDPVRMYDFWVSAETEAVASAVKTPAVLEEGQIEGHEDAWNNSNRRNTPYLLYKGVSVAGKPAPQPQILGRPGPPMGIVTAKEAAAQDILKTTGVRFDASKSERNMDESGIALQQLRSNTDLGAFHYPDNLARALRVTGGIFVRMIPKIYSGQRIVTILRENGSSESVQLNPYQAEPVKSIKDKRGKRMKSYNPGIGKYAVAVTIGPNYATKRKEQSAGMVEFMKVLPGSAPLIADKVAQAQDWEGADEISKRLAMQLPPGMNEESEFDLPPEAEAMMMQMKQQLQQLQQEKQQLLAIVTDKTTDQALEKHKIDADFEARITKIAADMETKMMQNVGAFITDQVGRAHEILMAEQAQQHAMEQMAAQPQPVQPGNGAAGAPQQGMPPNG